MTRKEFISLMGEAPEDVLGNDWENEIQDMQVLKSVEYETAEEEEAISTFNQ